VYNDTNFDYKFLTTNQDGVFRGNVFCDADYYAYSWPSQMQQAITFNVNNEVGTLETSDDGELVVLNNILIGNMEPVGFVYMPGASDSSYHLGTDSISAPLSAGTHSAQIWAFDYDGHFPVNYSLQVIDDSNSVIQTVSGTVDDWNASELQPDINIPQDGNYTITFALSDAMGAVGEASIYIFSNSLVTQ
jgi:hypothetical protein